MATINDVAVLPINGVIDGTDNAETIIAEAADTGTVLLIRGHGGEDTIATFGDNMTLDGGAGVDTLQSDGHNNTLRGGLDGDSLISGLNAVNTTMDGGAGSDFLIGGGTNDTASYASAPASVTGNGVTVDLGAGGVGTASDGDTLLGIENVTGSAFADRLTGNEFANVLTGGAGNDMLKGGLDADVFKYSFDLTQDGGGETFRFTDWLSEKYGRTFGDELPDFSPKHHHHHHHQHDKDDKHGNDDKHHSKNDDHGKIDQHDRQGKDDGHHSKHGDHDHHHRHGGDDGYHAQDGGLAEKFFEKNYKDWLRELVDTHKLGSDLNGNGKIKIDINEDSRDGTPRIEGLTKDELAEMFFDRDGVILNDDGETERAWYSNSFTSSGGQDTVVTSGDGFDTIADFVGDNALGLGSDRIQFNFTADANWGDPFVVAGNPDATKAAQLAFLEGFFDISKVDVSGDGTNDSTRISLNDNSNSWSTTLEATLLETPVVLAALDIYVNDIFIG